MCIADGVALDAWFGYTHCHCTWGPSGRWEVDRWCWSACRQTESTALPGNPSVLVGMAQCCRSGTSFCDPHRTYRRFWAYNNGKIKDHRGATQSLNLKITLNDLYTSCSHPNHSYHTHICAMTVNNSLIISYSGLLQSLEVLLVPPPQDLEQTL